MTGWRWSSLINAGTVCSQLAEDGVFTIRWSLLHLVEGVSWCGICGQESTSLVIVNGNLTIQIYVDVILRPTVLPILQQQPRCVIYQYDNARPYTDRMVQDFIWNQRVTVACRLARHVPNTTSVGCYRSTSTPCSQSTRTYSGPPEKNDYVSHVTSSDDWLTSMLGLVFACIEARGGHARY